MGAANSSFGRPPGCARTCHGGAAVAQEVATDDRPTRTSQLRRKLVAERAFPCPVYTVDRD